MDSIPPDDTPRKYCAGCNETYPATSDFFTSDKSKKDGLCSQCRTCRKKYRERNRERNRLNCLRYANEHREEKRAYDRQYCADHREERRAYDRSYRAENKDLINEKRKHHYWEYRKKELEDSSRYHHEHRAQIRARKQHYFATHKEQYRAYATKRRHTEAGQAYHKQYREAHKELYAEHGQRYRHTEHGRAIYRALVNKRRARRLAVPGTLTDQQIQEKLRLQHYRCYYCRKHFEKRNGRYIYHLDHTIPVSRPEAGPRHDMSYTVLACPHCNQSKRARLPHEWPEGGRLF